MRKWIYTPLDLGSKVKAGTLGLDIFLQIYFISVGDKILFIDGGWLNEVAADFLSYLAENIFNDSQYKIYLFNTHSDWDHAWANRAWIESLPSNWSLQGIYASRTTVERLRSSGKEGLVLPDHFIEDGDIFDLNGLKFHFLRANAHCPGQLVLYVPELKSLWSADALEYPWPFLHSVDNFAEQLRDWEEWLKLDIGKIFPCHDDRWRQDIEVGDYFRHYCGRELLLCNCKACLELKERLGKDREFIRRVLVTMATSEGRNFGELLEDEEAWLARENKVDFIYTLREWQIESLTFPEKNLSWFYLRAYYLAWLGAVNYLGQELK
ncbi:MBL fold metallo-hydrolase [bacterium]|nr:MBL fold metallo-hydrolase [bacterium]